MRDSAVQDQVGLRRFDQALQVQAVLDVQRVRPSVGDGLRGHDARELGDHPVMGVRPDGSERFDVRRPVRAADEHRAVRDMAEQKGVTPAQLAIAWVLRLPEVFTVAKASTRAHVMENRAALEIGFTEAELQALDRLFPPPLRKVALEVL